MSYLTWLSENIDHMNDEELQYRIKELQKYLNDIGLNGDENGGNRLGRSTRFL